MSDGGTWPKAGDIVFNIGQWDYDELPKADWSDSDLRGVVVRSDSMPGWIGVVWLDGAYRPDPKELPKIGVQEFDPKEWFPTRRAAMLAAAELHDGYVRESMAIAARLRAIAELPE